MQGEQQAWGAGSGRRRRGRGLRESGQGPKPLGSVQAPLQPPGYTDSTPSLSPTLLTTPLPLTWLSSPPPFFGGATLDPSCGVRALQSQATSSQVWPVGSSSLTRDGTRAPASGAWSLRTGPPGTSLQVWVLAVPSSISVPAQAFSSHSLALKHRSRLPVSCPNLKRGLNVHPLLSPHCVQTL